MEDRQPRSRRQFTAEFKRDAVDLVRSSDRPIAEIARELGIYDSTLGNWVRQDRIDRRETGLPATSRPGCERSSARTPRCGWSVTCSNEPSPSGSPNSRRRDALPLRRCLEGRRVPGRSGLPGGRGDPLGLLRLDHQRPPSS
jgi:Transposase